VGRPRRTGRLRTWLSTTRHRRPGRQLQPERAADGGRSSTHEQPPLGGGAGECPADRAGHWPAARLGRQRLAARGPGQVDPHRARWQTVVIEARIGPRRDRHGPRPVIG